MNRKASALLTASLLLSACTGLGAPDARSLSTSTGSSEPIATTTAATSDHWRTTVDLLDGSELEIEASHQLELTGYLFTMGVPAIGSSNVDLVPDVDPADASAVDEAAVLESDLGNGVRVWRANRAGQPIYMTIDLGGWAVFLHVGNEAPPDTELLLSIAEELRGETSEQGVVLPGDGVDVFTTYLRQPGSENSVDLGIGQCHGEVVPGSEMVEHPRRGEIVRGPGYASWCDPGNDLEVSVHGDDDFVDRTVADLLLTRRGAYPSELGEWTRATVGESEVGRAGDQVVSGIAAGPSGFVAVGVDEGRRDISEDDTAVVWLSRGGLSWSRVVSDPTFRDAEMRDVVWFPDGEAFVAVGRYVSQGAVWLSADGATWDRVAVLPFAGPGGGIGVESVVAAGPGLVAVGREWLSEGLSIPAAWTSVDGETWERMDLDVTDLEHGESAMVDVVSHKGGLLAVGFVPISAADQRPTPKLWTSSDAATWRVLEINEEDTLDSPLNGLGSDDRLVVAVGESDLDHVDARAWTSRDDGHTWTRVEVETGQVGIPDLNDVTRTGAGWVAVGSDGTTHHEFGETIAAVWLSTDGSSWTRYLPRHASLLPTGSATGLVMTAVSAFGDAVIAGGFEGATCATRFNGCDLDAAFWIWMPDEN